MVMFTVFLQGSTIKFIVKERKSYANVTLTEEINKKVFEHVMCGIEIISGKRGHFYAQNLFQHYDKKYLKKLFCVKDYDRNMKKIYEEISLGDHFLRLYGPSIISSDELNNNFKISDEKNGIANIGYEDFIKPDHVVKFLNSTKEKDLQRCNSLPVKVTMTNNNTTFTQSAKDISSSDLCRQSLRRALKKDPIGRLHQVHDRNLVKCWSK